MLSLFLITKSASYAIVAIIDYAEKTGLSKYFVGLFIVSIGTSLPELFTAIISATSGSVNLVLGDSIGATIADFTLVLGVCAVLAKKMRVTGAIVKVGIWKVLPVVLVPFILGIDGYLSRIDGAIMLSIFFIFYGVNIFGEIKKQKVKKDVPLKLIWKEIFIFGINIALLLFGVKLLVLSSMYIADAMKLPMYIFGAVFLSVCTTSGELVVEIKSILKNAAPTAFGDIFGSVVCNMSLVLGTAILISPTEIERFFYLTSIGFLIITSLSGLYFMSRRSFTRKHGIVLLGLFALFILLQILVLR